VAPRSCSTRSPPRGAVLRRLLGATFPGILGRDRLSTDVTYAAGRRQSCWSHFKRDLLSARELATTSATRLCLEALALQRQLFRLWHRFHGDPHARFAPPTRAQLIAKVQPIEKKFFALAERHVDAGMMTCRISRARCSCTMSTSSRSFTKTASTPPTTPPCEGSERPFSGEKSCLAIGAHRANLAVVRLLTVTWTCQLQQLHVLAYLTAAITYHRRRQAVPSLLPKPQTP
jgi:hypothetical protein